MASVLNLTVRARLLLAVIGTILYSIIAALAFVWIVGHAALSFLAVYAGHTGGPELVVSPVLAVAGVYLLIQSASEIHALWR